MITVLTGEDTYAHKEFVSQLEDGLERIQGEKLTPQDLPDIFLGTSLFSSRRVIVIVALSENKTAWAALVPYIEQGTDNHIILLEPSLDKRSSTWRSLKKHADIQDFSPLGERDQAAAITFVLSHIKLSDVLARHLVERVGTDKWALKGAIDKLKLLETITKEAIDEHIQANPSTNAFDLLDHALQGNTKSVSRTLEVLKTTEDPYRTWGLLCTQLFQLTAAHASLSGEGSISKDFGVHPFAAGKLKTAARNISARHLRHSLHSFTQADERLKTQQVDPWFVIEVELTRLSRSATV